MRISYLECTRCGEHFSADRPLNVCPSDGGVLFVRYDLAGLKGKLRREDLSGRVASMWRYAEVLPDATPVTLGEGFTPLLPSREFAHVFIKDEGLNPTGSFKARGMSAAVTMAQHYGLKKLAAPSAGMLEGRWRLMRRRRGLRRTSSCRRMCLWRIAWSAITTARTSRWWMG